MIPQKKAYTRILAITSTTLMLLISAPSSTVWARPFWGGGPGPMPFGHALIHVGPLAYFFLDGLFYRQGPRGYVVVPAPAGAVIEALPPAAIQVEIDGVPYYTCAGVYYKKTDNGYLVISQPLKQVNPEIVIGQRLEVNVDLLNVRSGPGFDYNIVQQIQRGSIVTVEALTSEWCLIHLEDKQSGWIMSMYTVALEAGGKG